MSEKVCSKCSERKPLGSFYDGNSVCKPCYIKRTRAWRDRNPEKNKSYYDRKNAQPDRKEYMRQYRKDYSKIPLVRLKHRIAQIALRARFWGCENDGSLTHESFLDIVESQGYKCSLCPIEITADSCHIDHIKPMHLMGRNSICNIQALCPTCNYKKGRRDDS